MLKITEITGPAGGVTLRLEGRLLGPWVIELEQACDRLQARGITPGLNLGAVEYLDRRGAALLVALRARGTALLDTPPFVAEQLKIATPG